MVDLRVLMVQILGASLTGIESFGIDKDEYNDRIESTLIASNKESAFLCQRSSTTTRISFVRKAGRTHCSHKSLAEQVTKVRIVYANSSVSGKFLILIHGNTNPT